MRRNEWCYNEYEYARNKEIKKDRREYAKIQQIKTRNPKSLAKKRKTATNIKYIEKKHGAIQSKDKGIHSRNIEKKC